jgi:hypothetical protein
MKFTCMLFVVALAACGKDAGRDKGPSYSEATSGESQEPRSDTDVAPETKPKAPVQWVDARKLKWAKADEAEQFLKIMSDAARSYYHVPGTTDSLMPEAKQFPASVGPTPPLGTCCKEGGACKPRAEAWAHPVWKSLDFAMREPHYYSYEIKSTKGDDGGPKSFTALAYGDLDCDGEYSTLSLYAEVVDGEIQTAGDIIKQNAME